MKRDVKRNFKYYITHSINNYLTEFVSHNSVDFCNRKQDITQIKGKTKYFLFRRELYVGTHMQSKIF